MTELHFYGINEPVPGARWQQLFSATWGGYRSWYLSEGDAARPSLATAADMLRRYMPELVPTWEHLAALAHHDPTAARMLTLYDPPRFLPGCSQAALTHDHPVLIRNYDYRPDLCERVVYSSAFTGRRVIGSSDCLWGLLDGMNDAGLVVSLTAVPSAVGRTGFAIPLVVRYVLEMAESVPEAIAVLSRVPVNMAYEQVMAIAELRAFTWKGRSETTPPPQPDCKYMWLVTPKCELDLWLAERKTLTTRLICRTGSMEHNVWIAQRAERMGMKWKPYEGLYKLRGGLADPEPIPTETEAAFYKALDMEYVAPANRELPWLTQHYR